MAAIYLFHYQAQNPRDLLRWAKSNDAVLVDTRRKVVSHQDTRWSQQNLTTLFGRRYLHLPRLGAEDVTPEVMTLFQAAQATHPNIVLITSLDMQGKMGEFLQARGIVSLELALGKQTTTNAEAIESPREIFTTLQQVADYLGIKVETVKYHLNISGHLQPYGKKEGGRWIFTKTRLDAYKRYADETYG